MYEGVDTIILENELAYLDRLPVAFRPLSRPLDPAQATALGERNARMLQVCAVIEEQGGIDKKDEAAPHIAELARLEVKVNLLLDLVGQLLSAQVPRPPATEIRFNALAARWHSVKPPRTGESGLLEIWLRDSLPQPLALVASITKVGADGQVKAALTPPGETVSDLLEKLAFRRHRRQVAGARQPRRSPG